MIWLFAAVAVLALGAIAVVASGRGEPMREVEADRAPFTLAGTGAGVAADLSGDDLREVRFSTAVRGYRMDEVDALLARLAAQLERAERDFVDETPSG